MGIFSGKNINAESIVTDVTEKISKKIVGLQQKAQELFFEGAYCVTYVMVSNKNVQ